MLFLLSPTTPLSPYALPVSELPHLASSSILTMAQAQILAVDTDIVHSEPMQVVVDALRAMQAAIVAATPANKATALTVWKEVAFYSNANARTTDFNLYKSNPANTEVVAAYTQEEWDAEMMSFGIVTDAVHEAKQKNFFIMTATRQNWAYEQGWQYKQTGQWSEEEQARHHARDLEWHEFVLRIDQRKASGPLILSYYQS